MKSEFNAIRDYIRLGEKPAHALVVRVKEPPLYQGNQAEARKRGRHLVGFDVEAHSTGMVGFVSLFYFIHYKILLGTLQLLSVPLSSAHYFDLVSRKVIEATATPVPPGVWLPGRS